MPIFWTILIKYQKYIHDSCLCSKNYSIIGDACALSVPMTGRSQNRAEEVKQIATRRGNVL